MSSLRTVLFVVFSEPKMMGSDTYFGGGSKRFQQKRKKTPSLAFLFGGYLGELTTSDVEIGERFVDKQGTCQGFGGFLVHLVVGYVQYGKRRVSCERSCYLDMPD